MTIAALIPFGLKFEDLVIFAAAATCIVTLAAVWQALVVRDPLTPRLKALAARRQALRSELLRPERRGRGILLKDGFIHRTVHRFNLRRSAQAVKAQIKLERAGFRGRDALVLYLFCKLSLPLLAAAAALISLYLLQALPLKEPLRMMVSFGLVLLGLAAPDIYLKNAADKRRAAMQKGLPDALDLMVICAEAGLSLDAALTRVGREMVSAAPELADELGLTAVELAFLPERQKALDNFNQRTNLAAIRGVVNTLQQTEKYGTPLAQSLRVLAAEFRDQRLMKAEEKAARLPAILTVPMIVFILPALFVVVLGPAIISVADGLKWL